MNENEEVLTPAEDLNPTPEAPVAPVDEAPVAPEAPVDEAPVAPEAQYYAAPTYEEAPVPPKKSKKGLIIAIVAVIVVAALAVGAYFLFLRGDDLEGTWETELDYGAVMTDMLEDSLGAPIEEDIALSLVTTITFNSDGTFVEAVDETSLEEGFEDFISSFAKALTEMMYTEAESMGMSREDFDAAMEAQGLPMDQFIELMISSLDAESLMDEMAPEMEGTYTVEDGKITLTYEDDLGTEIWEYTLEGDTLTVTDAELEDVSDDMLDLSEFLPVEFTRK